MGDGRVNGKPKTFLNLKQKPRKTRRGWGRKNARKNFKKKIHEQEFSIFGSNANGIQGKLDSLKNNINTFQKPTCINIQETKMRFKGIIRLEGYQIFENVRSGFGGGLLTAVSQDISPVLVYSRTDEIEMMVVQGKIGEQKIRIFNCYGPQELSQAQRPAVQQQDIINKFWVELEKEVIKAYEEECLIVIEMDANAKVGKHIINGDPHNTSENGKLLLDFIERQNLNILNCDKKCSGTVTRKRVTVDRVEESIIDFIITCNTLADNLDKMLVDDKRQHVLTKFASRKGYRKKIESDHNILFGKFRLKYNTKKNEVRREVFNFNDKESQNRYYEVTSNGDKFSNIFNGKGTIEKQVNKFYKNLDDIFHQCFKKIRIKTKNSEKKNDEEREISEKLKLKQEIQAQLKIADCKIAKTFLSQMVIDLEEEIGTKISDKNASKVNEYVAEFNLSGGKFSQTGLWKLKNKLCPKPSDPPMAKKDTLGNLVTEPNQLKELYISHYKHRLRHRKIEADFEDLFKMKNDLWKYRLDILRRRTTEPWKISALDRVLKSLKNNQSRDPMGMISEIFKPGVMGDGMKWSILDMMNNIKACMFIPTNMQLANITTIYKARGSRLELVNDRGIFLLTIFRKILDKLTYIDKYPELDNNMSDSNIGARKNKNIRNHLFIIHGIINSVIQGEDTCVDIQVYDVEQAFDALWLEDCLNDLYDSLPDAEQDDKLALVYETNVKNLVAVNTGVGQTTRIEVPRIVQQGGGWGPMQCSNSIDTIGKRCRDRGIHFYLYKHMVRVVPLSMVDDILGIGKCGKSSLALNMFISTQIQMKKLRFSQRKCHKLHVGKSTTFCPELRVHGSPMRLVHTDTYLGDVLSSDGKNTANIDARISKGHGILSNILKYLETVSFGAHYFKIALLLRESLLLNGILTNSECWYGISEAEIKRLESLDLTFFRNLFEVPHTVPTVGLYLETGSLSIHTILKVRRLLFLQYLVKLKPSEMLSKFFWAQWNKPAKLDWTLDVIKDLEALGIVKSIDQIKSMSKYSYKKLVMKKAREFELNRCLEIKATKSKMKNLIYPGLELQDYLLLKDMNVSQAKALFKFRLRMAPFGENFKGGSEKVLCPLCGNHPDGQEESFMCEKMKQMINIQGNYNQVFGWKFTKEFIQTIQSIYEFREEYRKLG